MRGTWRISAYTDPKGAPVGEASFLVEDYVPGAARGDAFAEDAGLARRPAGRDRRRGALSLRRAGRRSRRLGRGRRSRPRRRRGIKGLEGFTGRPRGRDRSRRRPPRSRSTARPTRRARVVMSVPVQKLAAPRPARGQDHAARRRGRADAPSSAASRCRSCRRARSSACARTSAAISPRARLRPSTW